MRFVIGKKFGPLWLGFSRRIRVPWVWLLIWPFVLAWWTILGLVWLGVFIYQAVRSLRDGGQE